MGYTSRRMEDSGAVGDLNCGCLNQGLSGEMNFSIRPEDSSGDIL